MTRDASEHEHAVRAKLTRILGAEKGERVLVEITQELAIAGISTPDDVLLIAGALGTRGGMLALVGDSLTIHARLRGARSRR